MKTGNVENNVKDNIRSILLDDGHFLFRLKKKSTSSTWSYFDAKNKNGITLIAVIITIIIILILSAVVINLTIGENGLFRITKNFTLKTKIKEIEEQAQLIYADKKAKELIGEEEATLTTVINDLKFQKYTIKEIVNEGKTITKILLNKNNIDMEFEEEQELDYTLDYGDNAVRYFIEIQSKYYEIVLYDGNIYIEEEESDLEKVEGTQTNNEIIVESNKEAIVSAEKIEEGKVKLKAGSVPGSVDITVKEKNSNITAVCKITVKMHLSHSSINLAEGDTMQITAEGNLDGVTWSSEDTNIATVNEQGLVTAKAKGTTKIIATYEGQTVECIVNIMKYNILNYKTKSQYQYTLSSSSNIGATRGPEKVFDGSLDGSTGCWHADLSSGTDQWWGITFDREFKIGRFTLTNRVENCTIIDFYLQGSKNGTNWVNLQQFKNRKGSCVETKFDVTNVYGDGGYMYYRWYATSSEYYAVIGEMEIEFYD